eukprot:TRINITY_DN7701_c0_g4_i3.p1 TRINITY_DN7701_c0_g4~~TRINITY_DN7701_c0_g4_i3.p1  ORF type:complete len:535 (+),score=9.50 TRINITY_DN7701_c0_g4_i3:492-2096(+)
MESAYYITTAGKSLPEISPQQLIDCQGTGNCNGGWPGDAIEYASTNFLASSDTYPYKGLHQTCNKAVKGAYQLKGYERVNFFGWYGLLIAVQQQPVIINLEGSRTSFLNYQTGIYQDHTCFYNGVDHTVVIVGYDLTPPQYWLIKNSWGPEWGESGYMRIAMTGGDGICGMNTMPGFFPVFKGNDPCYSINYGSSSATGAPGQLNPCGGGTCRVVGKVNECTKCPSTFVVATNADGSQTCVPASVCTFLTYDPCGVGFCIDVETKPGTYTCICPLGFVIGIRTLDGTTTCIPASYTTVSYKVPPGIVLTCSAVAHFYGIPYNSFVKSQQKGVSCSGTLKEGTVLALNGARACRLPYTTNLGDTCGSIATLFRVSAKATFGRKSALNPDTNCAIPFPIGTNVCIVAGHLQDLPLCISSLISQSGDTCESITSKFFKGNATEFFLQNLGIMCANLVQKGSKSNAVPGQEVCLTSTSFGTIKKGCKKVYTWMRGDTCLAILRRFFSSKQRVFQDLNKKIRCLDKNMYAGATICRPST